MSLPEPTSAVRPHEYDKFHALFEGAFPRPSTRAQISNWKFKREMAWRGWLWARQTPYIEPKSTLTTMFTQPLTPDVIAAMASEERHCTICGFAVDTSKAAIAPTVHFTMAGRTKKK